LSEDSAAWFNPILPWGTSAPTTRFSSGRSSAGDPGGPSRSGRRSTCAPGLSTTMACRGRAVSDAGKRTNEPSCDPNGWAPMNCFGCGAHAGICFPHEFSWVDLPLSSPAEQPMMLATNGVRPALHLGVPSPLDERSAWVISVGCRKHRGMMIPGVAVQEQRTHGRQFPARSLKLEAAPEGRARTAHGRRATSMNCDDVSRPLSEARKPFERFCCPERFPYRRSENREGNAAAAAGRISQHKPGQSRENRCDQVVDAVGHGPQRSPFETRNS